MKDPAYRSAPVRRGLALIIGPILALGSAACGDPPGVAAGGRPRPQAAGALGAQEQAERRKVLSSATDSFRLVADGALGRDFPALDVEIVRLHVVTAAALSALTPEQGADLVHCVNLIETARDRQARPDMALAGAAGYRLLVVAAPPAAIPAEVGLLDYSGLRFAADVAADPPRWTDAVLAADEAGEFWDQVAPRVRDVGLRGRFGAAVIDLKRAARARNFRKAEAVIRSRSGLLDELAADLSPESGGADLSARPLPDDGL